MDSEGGIVKELLNQLIALNKDIARLEVRIKKLEEENRRMQDLIDDIYSMHKETAERHEKFLKKLYAMINNLARRVGVDLSYSKDKHP